MKERYETYLQTLQEQREQLYRLIRSAENDPKADSDEIDRYLDLLNDVNRMTQVVQQLLDKLKS